VQPLQEVLLAFHHSKNHTFTASSSPACWAGRRPGTVLYPSASVGTHQGVSTFPPGEWFNRTVYFKRCTMVLNILREAPSSTYIHESTLLTFIIGSLYTPPVISCGCQKDNDLFRPASIRINPRNIFIVWLNRRSPRNFFPLQTVCTGRQL
jgi:hypothetical protein